MQNRNEKKPTEICFIESIRLVAFCVEENNQTNIYTLHCIRFHVQAQPGWQTFKHFRDEEKRFVFGGSLLTLLTMLTLCFYSLYLIEIEILFETMFCLSFLRNIDDSFQMNLLRLCFEYYRGSWFFKIIPYLLCFSIQFDDLENLLGGI